MPGQDAEKKDFKITQNFVPYYSCERTTMSHVNK